jgi:hypothetical protein
MPRNTGSSSIWNRSCSTNNYQCAHSRTAFTDAQEPARRRHVLRLWNRTTGSVALEGA